MQDISQPQKSQNECVDESDEEYEAMEIEEEPCFSEISSPEYRLFSDTDETESETDLSEEEVIEKKTRAK